MIQEYPMITGLSVPWLTTEGVSDGFNVENIQTKVAFDKNYAVVRLNLKDLEEERYYKGSPDTRIYSWRLKQEAIKWVEIGRASCRERV